MTQCNCDRFELLVGAATRVYTLDFLEQTGRNDATGDVYYRCRLCGTPWKRVEQKDAKTPKLIKLSKSAMA
jgi:hypothetical protein